MLLDRRKRTISRPRRCAVERLEPRVLLAADPLISEFLAVNRGGLTDEQGHSPDWVEIHNPADTPVDLAGWSLTDRPSDLRRWVFPDYPLEPGEYGIVFASGADRTHSDALVRDVHTTPDGTFLVDLPNGTYDVELTLGDRDRGRDNMAVHLQGQLVDVVTTATDRFVTLRYRTQVSAATSGTLTVRLEDTGGDTTRAAIAGLAVTPVDDGLPRQFDFGTSGSPVANGFERVTAADRYAPQSGFGWLAESVVSDVDRGAVTMYPHTNFSLDGSGDFLALVSPAGEIVSQYGTPDLEFPPQYANVSYGLMSSNETPRVGYFAAPTPGGLNATDQVMTGPAFYAVTDQPGAIADDHDLIVTAAVEPLNAPVASAELTYRVMYGSDVSVAMVDDGLGADMIPGDGVFTAAIPRDAAAPGEMFRWYVTAADVTGDTARVPQFFAPNASPEYFGTVVADPAVDSALPILQWFLQPGTEAAADTRTGTRAALFYAGEFYDNVFVRVRGGTSARLVKKSYKFDFNSGNHFQFDTDTPRVSEINVNTTYTNKDTIRQALAFDTYDAAGVAGSVAFPIRVQRNSSFFSVAMFVEQPDEDLIEREGLDPEGALYKMFNTFTSGTSRVEKKTRHDEDNSDLVDFIAQVNGAAGEELKRVIFDQVDIPAVVNYLAATVIIQNNDQSAKNYYLYRDTEGTGEWRVLPWDLDLTLGLHFMTNDSILDDTIWANKDAFTTQAGVTIWPSHPFVGDQEHPGNRSWNRLIDTVYRVPEFREMYLRRLRSLMDQLLQPPETPPDALRFEQQLDDWVARLAPDVALDYAEWADPWAWGEDLSLTEAIDRIKTEYLAVRRVHLYETHSIDRPGTDVAGIPHAQVGNPPIAIDPSDFEIDPVSGNWQEQYLKLNNANDQAVDISGWRLRGPIELQFQPGTVIPAGGSLYVAADVATFRRRRVGPQGGQGLFVEGGYEGRMDSLGETIELVAPDGSVMSALTLPYTPSDAQSQLRITELHYHPLDSESTEFVELMNIGDTPVNLAGVALDDGVEFQFGVAALAPGERIVAVRDQAAFESYYGAGLNIAGQFLSGGLNNGGEQIRLVDARGGVIVEFRYDDSPPWPAAADGTGPSLEVVDTEGDYGSPSNWRASRQAGGTPGAAPQILGDMNLDGVVSSADVGSFVLALNDPTAYAAAYGVLATDGGDIDQDGDADFDDISGLVALIRGVPAVAAESVPVTAASREALPATAVMTTAAPRRQRPVATRRDDCRPTAACPLPRHDIGLER